MHTKQCTSKHTDLSILDTCKQKKMAVYGRELTSYQTLLSPSGCFSACSAFQRNIAETFCICSIFTELFPPSLVNLLLCWLVYPPVQQVILHADYEGKLRLMFKQGWGGWGKRCSQKCFPSCHLAWLSWIAFYEEKLPKHSSSCVHHCSNANGSDGPGSPNMFSQTL